MRFDVISLFPAMLDAVRDQGITGRAHTQGIWSLHAWNPRDFSCDPHRRVDDRPYGGGPGMVMSAQPLEDAVRAAQHARAQSLQAPEAPVILMSPAGRRLNQQMAQELAHGPGAILVCGRYEGMDQRFIDRCVDWELSIGDFVLSGGEIAALAVIDAVVRLLPGALGHEQSALQDSFHPQLYGLLDSPHYTRPESYQGMVVPPILLSGHHACIERWRHEQSLRLTAQRRPELIEAARLAGCLSSEDERFLATLTQGSRPCES